MNRRACDTRAAGGEATDNACDGTRHTDPCFERGLLLPGGLGDLNYPLVADLKKEICEKYGVLTGEQGAVMQGAWLVVGS